MLIQEKKFRFSFDAFRTAVLGWCTRLSKCKLLHIHLVPLEQSAGRAVEYTNYTPAEVKNSPLNGSRISGAIRKWVPHFPIPCCSSHRKGSLRVTLDYGRSTFLYIYIYIYTRINDSLVRHHNEYIVCDTKPSDHDSQVLEHQGIWSTSFFCHYSQVHSDPELL